MPAPQSNDSIGFPPGFKLFALQGMKGLNTKAQRPAIDDQECAWIENFFPIGNANARTLYGVAPTIYTAGGGKTILWEFYYNIGATAFGVAFLSDGSADQFRLSDGAVTNIAGAGTFGDATHIPHAVQWSNAGILIVSTLHADAYWAWDGALAAPTNPSPAWLNGGTPTNMPTGVNGTAIEIYLGRVWIASGTNLLTSAPSNGATFASGAGGLTKPNQDSSLRVKYTGLKQANGYLYVFGDSETAYITNVQTSTVPTTTYQYTVIDPQIGTPWRDSVINYGRSIILGNTNGVYAVYGSTVNKISDQLDGIWNDTVADFTTVTPSAGASTIFGIKTLIMTLRTTDPTTNTMRNLLACFDGTKWFMASQDAAPIQIAPQETDSHLETFGNDGTHLYKLFNVASATLPKKIVSKLWGGEYGPIAYKQALRFYAEIELITLSTLEVFLTLDNEAGSTNGEVSFNALLVFVNNSGGVLQFQNNSLGNLFWQSNARISKNNLNGQGLLLGFTLSSLSPDFVLLFAGIGYINKTALY